MSNEETGTKASTLACKGCSKPIVSLCARCAEREYSVLARENPLCEREPELYKKLDELSRLPLQGNEELYGEFCVEIGAGDHYEHLPVLAEILHEGNWRTGVWKVKPWIRQDFARRVRRAAGTDDFDSTGKRRPPKPPGANFDKRSGLLISYETRPFVEFEAVNDEGDAFSPEDVIDNAIVRKNLQTAGGMDEPPPVSPADKDTRKFLRDNTWAEWLSMGEIFLLEEDRPLFNKRLADTISHLSALASHMSLDRDETEALSVKALLWSHGARAYLKFLDEPKRRRLRNAFDRLDRKLKNPEWQRSLRKALREFGSETRRRWYKEYGDDYEF